MMRSIAVVLSACLLGCAFALPSASLAENPIIEPKEVKLDGSTDWSKVVGGSQASSGQFPYMVSLRRTNTHFCGAAIVSQVYLLSAAHCTIGNTPSSVTAVVGTTTLLTGGTGYVLSNILDHPDYDSRTIENDISLLRTESAIVGSSLVASIPISSGTVGAGLAVVLSGWGRTSENGNIPNVLQYVNLLTIDNTECGERHYYPVFTSNLCTYTQVGEGACYLDSGGPLVADGILVGIVSWGEPCGVGYPDVFTRVSSFVDWILENAT